MKKDYLTPLLEAVKIDSEGVFLYSGLKDMSNEVIFPEDDLDDDV